MVNVSQNFKDAIDNDCRNYIIKAKITLADSTVLDVDNTQIWDEGFSFEEATSDTNAFSIGSTVISKATLILNNIYDDFKDYDFYDATVEVKIGLVTNQKEVAGGAEPVYEEFRKGFYTVDEPKYRGSLITLSLLDNMWKFEKDFDKNLIPIGSTIGNAVAMLCSYCGVTLGDANFRNKNATVVLGNVENTNCREILGYLAQLCCCYCKIDSMGELHLEWYNPSGDEFEIKHIKTINVGMQDVVVTGLRVYYKNESILIGTDTYVLAIKENPFINSEEEALEFGNYIAGNILGTTLRKFSISALNAPYVEAGDLCEFTDAKGNTYTSVINQIRFTVGNAETFECNLEEPSRNKVVHYSEKDKTVVEARRATQEEISNYDKAVQNMTQLAMNTMGFFQTVEKQADGSVITYIHNKPTLDESKTIFKMTSEGFFVSTDGGETYSAGFDAQGNAIVNILSAIGIQFDWARGGTLSLGGDNNVNGQIYIYDADGNECGVINNNGIAIYSPVNQTQIIMSPLVGFILRDADGNEFFGLSFDRTFNGKPYLNSVNAEKYGTYSDGTPYFGYTNQPVKQGFRLSVEDVDEYKPTIEERQNPTSPYLPNDKRARVSINHNSTRLKTNAILPILYGVNYSGKLENGTLHYVVEAQSHTEVIQLPDNFKGKNIACNLIVSGKPDLSVYENPSESVLTYTYVDTFTLPYCYEDCDYVTNWYNYGVATYITDWTSSSYRPSGWDSKKKLSPYVDFSQYPDSIREQFGHTFEFPSEFFDLKYSYEVDNENATVTITYSALGRLRREYEDTNINYVYEFINMNEFIKFRLMCTC